MNTILLIAALALLTLVNIAITIHRKKYPKEIIVYSVPWGGWNCRHSIYPLFTGGQMAAMEATEFDPDSCDR